MKKKKNNHNNSWHLEPQFVYKTCQVIHIAQRAVIALLLHNTTLICFISHLPQLCSCGFWFYEWFNRYRIVLHLRKVTSFDFGLISVKLFIKYFKYFLFYSFLFRRLIWRSLFAYRTLQQHQQNNEIVLVKCILITLFRVLLCLANLSTSSSKWK